MRERDHPALVTNEEYVDAFGMAAVSGTDATDLGARKVVEWLDQHGQRCWNGWSVDEDDWQALRAAVGLDKEGDTDR